MRRHSYLSRSGLLIASMLALTACGGAAGTVGGFGGRATSASPPTRSNGALPGEQPKAFTIGLVMKTLTNPFFVEMEKGARQAEKDFGINLVVRTGAQETSIEQQITIVRDLIKENVDAIVIAPADSSELIPVLKEAQDAWYFYRQYRQPTESHHCRGEGFAECALHQRRQRARRV